MQYELARAVIDSLKELSQIQQDALHQIMHDPTHTGSIFVCDRKTCCDWRTIMAQVDLGLAQLAREELKRV